MVTDQQVRKLMSLIEKEQTLAAAAAKAGMDEKTARKYRRLGRLPSEERRARTNRTREDPFDAVWEEVREKLAVNPGLEAKTLFADFSGGIRGGSRTGRCARFSGGSSAGGHWKDRPRKCSSPRCTTRGALPADFTS